MHTPPCNWERIRYNTRPQHQGFCGYRRIVRAAHSVNQRNAHRKRAGLRHKDRLPAVEPWPRMALEWQRGLGIRNGNYPLTSGIHCAILVVTKQEIANEPLYYQGFQRSVSR